MEPIKDHLATFVGGYAIVRGEVTEIMTLEHAGEMKVYADYMIPNRVYKPGDVIITRSDKFVPKDVRGKSFTVKTVSSTDIQTLSGKSVNLHDIKQLNVSIGDTVRVYGRETPVIEVNADFFRTTRGTFQASHITDVISKGETFEVGDIVIPITPDMTYLPRVVESVTLAEVTLKGFMGTYAKNNIRKYDGESTDLEKLQVYNDFGNITVLKGFTGIYSYLLNEYMIDFSQINHAINSTHDFTLVARNSGGTINITLKPGSLLNGEMTPEERTKAVIKFVNGAIASRP